MRHICEQTPLHNLGYRPLIVAAFEWQNLYNNISDKAA